MLKKYILSAAFLRSYARGDSCRRGTVPLIRSKNIQKSPLKVNKLRQRATGSTPKR